MKEYINEETIWCISKWGKLQKILGNIKNTGNISKACRKVSICKGYIFSYNKEDLVNIEYISNIWCKSPCGEIILFDNGNKASKSLNIRFGAIYDVLNGKKITWMVGYSANIHLNKKG